MGREHGVVAVAMGQGGIGVNSSHPQEGRFLPRYGCKNFGSHECPSDTDL